MKKPLNIVWTPGLIEECRNTKMIAYIGLSVAAQDALSRVIKVSPVLVERLSHFGQWESLKLKVRSANEIYRLAPTWDPPIEPTPQWNEYRLRDDDHSFTVKANGAVLNLAEVQIRDDFAGFRYGDRIVPALEYEAVKAPDDTIMGFRFITPDAIRLWL